MKLNPRQNKAVYSAIDCLKDAREYLDIAMYRLGEIDNEDLAKLREVYGKICEAMDLL